MSVVYTVLAVLAFLVLTAGTAVFVAAEFSLTALERSTVDANARSGGRRDKLVQRAHRTLVVPALGRPGGHLDHHADHRLPRRAAGGSSAGAGLHGDVGVPRPRQRPGAGAGAADRHLGVDGVRRTRRPIPRGGQAAADRACGGGPAGDVLDAVHPADPPDQRHRQLDPAAAGHRARRGTALGPFAAGARCRWCATRRGGVRWTRSPRRWSTVRCSSARGRPRS